MKIKVAELELCLNAESNRVSRFWFPSQLAEAFNSIIIQVADGCKGIDALVKDKGRSCALQGPKALKELNHGSIFGSQVDSCDLSGCNLNSPIGVSITNSGTRRSRWGTGHGGGCEFWCAASAGHGVILLVIVGSGGLQKGQRLFYEPFMGSESERISATKCSKLADLLKWTGWGQLKERRIHRRPAMIRKEV